MACRKFLLLVCVFAFASAQSDMSEGSECSLPNGRKGVCVLFSNCASAIEDAIHGNTPATCSFSGISPVVCCLQSNLTGLESSVSRASLSKRIQKRSPVAGTISKQKCVEYSKAVYRLESTFIPGEKANVSLCGVDYGSGFIRGGIRADPREFPHAALVGFGEESDISWWCGGTLISPGFVITAAHCMRSKKGDARWVRVGDLNINDAADEAEPQDVQVAERIPHPDYSASALYNDIALLRLAKNVNLNEFVRPACLHTTFDIGKPSAVAVGWGRTFWANEQGSDHLMKVSLLLQPTEICNKAYKSVSTTAKLRNGIEESSMLCAGYIEGEKDTCRGDSGGPLHLRMDNPYCMYDLIGVTSFGKPVCGSKYSPTIYTRVSNYISWIEKIVWP